MRNVCGPAGRTGGIAGRPMLLTQRQRRSCGAARRLYSTAMTDPSPDQIKRGQIKESQIKESQIKDGKIQDAQITELRTAIDAIVRMFKIGDDIAAGTTAKLNPSDVQTLLFIGTHDLCTGTDIAGFLGVVPTTASAIIERLVKRGLVVRNRTEANRRIVQLSLTGDGRAGHKPLA